MAYTLNQKIGEAGFDGLFSGWQPAADVRVKTIAKLSAAAVLKRGTLLAKNSAGKLVVYAGTSGTTPDCVLCDDVEVGTSDDVNVPVYISGCFDPDHIIVGTSYVLTDEDFDTLRMKSILFKNAQNY